MELTFATYRPFDGVRRANDYIVECSRAPSASCLDTALKIVKIVAVAIFSLVLFCFEVLAALPVLAAQRCVEQRAPAPQPALPVPPNPAPQAQAPAPRQEFQMQLPVPQQEPQMPQPRFRLPEARYQEPPMPQVPFRLPEAQLEQRIPDDRVVRAPDRVQPALPEPEAIPEEAGARPVTQQDVAHVLGNPIGILFPEDIAFFTGAIAKGMEELPQEKQDAYRRLITNPMAAAGEVDPHEWVAACSIAHYLIFKWHAHAGNQDCPAYLGWYEMAVVPGSKTLRQMSRDFSNLNPAGGERTAAQYADQAGVLIKLRDPKRPVALSLQARQLVHAANVLAQKIGTDRFVRDQILLY